MVVATRTTHLQGDDPARADEFGTHSKIAALIRDEILHSEEGRSIALVGDWGSGKSTIIELLRSNFASGTPSDTHIFTYDAWSHQGDSLRRAFLDDFIASARKLLSASVATTATEQIWNRTETTTTTKEPVLRRHAKALLVSIALIPIGMKLFEIPSDQGFFEGLFLCRNILAYFFLLAPVLAVALFGFFNQLRWALPKDFLFGDSHKEPGFSVLSFFFEKVQGHVERKHIKTPVDSIRTFRDVFSFVLDSLHESNRTLRVVIVIDNIDRIPPEQARDFWSTMQTFFGDGGGLRQPRAKKYWLVVPFSIEALSFLFQDKSLPFGDTKDAKIEAKLKAQAYIDKTFGLALHVPPPILTNWRKYLFEKLRVSFPQHDVAELISVRDAFDFARSGTAQTPRAMKLFVNSLVALYRQRGEDISLPVMAIYMLQREKIVGVSINEDLLSPREQRLIEGADWRTPIAALHFGVTLEEATQLLLQEPILSALRVGSREELKGLEPRPGFGDVLRHVTSAELESPDAEKGSVLAQLAFTIQGLDGASKPELTGIWSDIRKRLISAKVWEGLQANSAGGIAAVIMHTAGSERASLCTTLAASLSRAVVSEPSEDYQKVNTKAEHWLASAKVVLEKGQTDKPPTIILPGTINLRLELLLQLSESDMSVEQKRAFALGVSPEEMSKELANDIRAGRFPRAQFQFVSLLSEVLNVAVRWDLVSNASAERLRVVDVGAKETESLIELLVAALTIGGFGAATNILKELSEQGSLLHLLYQHREEPTVRSRVVAAIFLTNPAFERSGQVNQSQNGDNAFNEIVNSTAFDARLIEDIAIFVVNARAERMVFEAGANNPKVARLAAATVGQLVRSSLPIDIEPSLIVDHRIFLEANAELNPIEEFLRTLKRLDGVLAQLSGAPFQVECARFYLAAMNATSDVGSSAFEAYLSEGMEGLSKTLWEKVLVGGSRMHDELLKLACELRQRRTAFVLSVPARDAALEQVRRVGGGKPAPSDEMRDRLSKLLGLLSDGMRSSLVRDLVDDMAGQSDAANLTRRIEAVGDHLNLDAETDVDRTVRRILSLALEKPSERSATWVATMVERRQEFFLSMPSETKDEFTYRLRVAVKAQEASSPSIAESLRNVAGLLKLNLSSSEPDTPEQT